MTNSSPAISSKVVLVPGASSGIGEAIELTTFRLFGDKTAKDFVAANASIDAWLKRQPGFQSRRIAELDDGTIFDMLIWDTAAHGSDAAGRIISETRESPVHAMIDHHTVVWQIAEVRHQTGKP